MSKLVVQDVQHSPLGASGASRWMNCAGSVNLTRKLGDKARGAGPEAALGTAAHTLASYCLDNNCDAWELLGEMIISGTWNFEVDQDMVEAVQMYLDTVRNLYEQYKDQGAILFVEHPLASVLDEDAYGTGDTVICVPGVKIIVVDYKNGANVCVEPNSSQLKEYGYLAYENWPDKWPFKLPEGVANADPDVIETWIVQPRMPHPLGPVRKASFPVTEIIKWFENEVLPAMARTREKNATLAIGEWCQFCPARDNCPALAKESMEFAIDIEPVHFTDEEIGTILEKKKPVEKFLESIAEEAYKRKMNGKDVPGQKLVRKKAHRVFKDKRVTTDEKGNQVVFGLRETVAEEFGDDAFVPAELKTPPNIEKLGAAGKRFVSKWAFTPDTGLTIAAISDKRLEVRRPMEDFIDSENTKNSVTSV